jgi:hypothetical protein
MEQTDKRFWCGCKFYLLLNLADIYDKLAYAPFNQKNVIQNSLFFNSFSLSKMQFKSKNQTP